MAFRPDDLRGEQPLVQRIVKSEEEARALIPQDEISQALLSFHLFIGLPLQEALERTLRDIGDGKRGHGEAQPGR